MHLPGGIYTHLGRCQIYHLSLQVVLNDSIRLQSDAPRLQEIVFIGAGMDQAAISDALDGALLDDEEFEKYRANWARLPDPEHPGLAAA